MLLNEQTRINEVIAAFPDITDRLIEKNDIFRDFDSAPKRLAHTRVTVGALAEKAGVTPTSIMSMINDCVREELDNGNVGAFTNRDMLIGELIDKYPGAAEALMQCGMSCVTCFAALSETVMEASMVHGLNPDDVTDYINSYLSAEGLE